MTAEQLATELAAGNKRVVALQDLEPTEFARQLTALTVEAMVDGMDPAAAVAAALLVAKAYVAMRPISEEQRLQLLKELERL
jgi:hypothetical protein